MRGLWRFLGAKKNREILAWLGGGGVVAAGGIWTAVTFFAGNEGSAPPPSTTINAPGGVAA